MAATKSEEQRGSEEGTTRKLNLKMSFRTLSSTRKTEKGKTLRTYTLSEHTHHGDPDTFLVAL